MALDVSRIISFVRSVLNEEQPGFWKDPTLVQYLNSAVEYIIYEVYDATETTFLREGTITIVQGDVDAGTKSYALPSRTIYVSDYNEWDPLRGEIDYRPLRGSTRLIREQDYYINGNFLVLSSAPTATGTIKLMHKTLHTIIYNPAGSLDNWIPDLAFNPITTYMLEYTRLRDEANAVEINSMIKPLLEKQVSQLRGFLTGLHGKTRVWRLNWDMGV